MQIANVFHYFSFSLSHYLFLLQLFAIPWWIESHSVSSACCCSPVNEIKFALIFAVEKVFSFEKRTPKITRISAAALRPSVCVCERVCIGAPECVCVSRASVRLCLCPLKVYTFWGLIAGIKVVALAAWWASAIRYDMLRCDVYLSIKKSRRIERVASRHAMPYGTFLPCVSNGQRRWCPSRTTTTTRDDADADDVVKYFWVQGGVRSLRKLFLLQNETWQQN